MAAFFKQGTLAGQLARFASVLLALFALSYLVYCAGAGRSDAGSDGEPPEKLDPYMPSTKSAPVEVRPEDLRPDPAQQQKKSGKDKKKKPDDSKKTKPDIYAPSTKVGVLTRPVPLP